MARTRLERKIERVRMVFEWTRFSDETRPECPQRTLEWFEGRGEGGSSPSANPLDPFVGMSWGSPEGHPRSKPGGARRDSFGLKEGIQCAEEMSEESKSVKPRGLHRFGPIPQRGNRPRAKAPRESQTAGGHLGDGKVVQGTEARRIARGSVRVNSRPTGDRSLGYREPAHPVGLVVHRARPGPRRRRDNRGCRGAWGAPIEDWGPAYSCSMASLMSFQQSLLRSGFLIRKAG